MKKKTIVKIFLFIMIFSIINICIISPILAVTDETAGSSYYDSVKINPDKFKPDAITESDYKEAFNLGGVIVAGVRIVGVVIAILGIIIIGIKYMMGSTEDKADYKKTAIPYLIGCVLIFAITQIVALIYDLASTL